MDSIRFVVGLGNPEEKYRHTPHNVGRELVEFHRERLELPSWKKGKQFDWTDSTPSCVLLHAYMNLSGEAVRRLLEKFNADPRSLLVCLDDFDLPLGALRLRKKGSAGSHNGLKSVIERLGTEDFPRLRLGVGPVPPGADPARFVLEPFPKASADAVRSMIRKASEAVQAACSEGFEAAMNRHNG
jgi:PTH1 family peptidyl-tRNA hydrolase